MNTSDAATPNVLQVCGVGDGGAAEHVLNLSSGLVDLGWRVTLIAPESWLSREAASRGIATTTTRFARAPNLGADAAAYRAIRRTIAGGDFDIVHAHSSKAGVLGRFAARRSRVPAIFTPHAWSFLSSTGAPLTGAWIAVERAAAATGAWLLCVSESERQEGAAHGLAPDGRTVVVANGVSLPERAAALNGDARPVIGTIARLSRQKGLDVLLRALPSVFEGSPGARVEIVGGGPLEDELGALATSLGVADRVAFLGARDGARRLLDGWDVFVLPSRWEGMSIALLEARAAGLPCVATRVGGVEEVVQDGVDGIVVAPEDSDALARALTSLAEDPDLRRRYGLAARERIARDFTFAATVSRTEAAYLSCLLHEELAVR